MLISRVLEPNPNDVFYHYCSVDTFAAICRNKTMRFSDINMMNDYEEFRLGYTTFEEAATRILNDKDIQQKFPGITKDFFDKVDQVISPMQMYIHPVICSFSRNSDLLSQWRAYGDDGRGFAVGLSGETLSAMPATILEVLYEKNAQLMEMTAALLAIYTENVADKSAYGSKFKQSCILMGAWMLGFKNSSFSEEKEVRCVHLLDVRRDNDLPKLVDAGGSSAGRNVKGQKVNYRVSDSSIVAYVDIPIPILKSRPTIQEVWVGPKNSNGLGNIIYLMSDCGLKGYSIHGSRASYR